MPYALRAIKGSKSLKVLDLNCTTLDWGDIAIIETLSNLEVLKGFVDYFEEINDNFLDKIFKSIGKTLRILEIYIGGNYFPSVLFQKNHVLKELKIVQNSTQTFRPKNVIRLCEGKQDGFRLKITNDDAKFTIDEFIYIVKKCQR